MIEIRADSNQQKNLEAYHWECQTAKGDIRDSCRVFGSDERIQWIDGIGLGFIRIWATSMKEAQSILAEKYPEIAKDPRDIRFSGTIPITWFHCCLRY